MGKMKLSFYRHWFFIHVYWCPLRKV